MNDKIKSFFQEILIKNGKLVKKVTKINGKEINDKILGNMDKINCKIISKDFTKDQEISDKIKDNIMSTTTKIIDDTKKEVELPLKDVKKTNLLVYKFFNKKRNRLYFDQIYDPTVDYPIDSHVIVRYNGVKIKEDNKNAYVKAYLNLNEKGEIITTKTEIDDFKQYVYNIAKNRGYDISRQETKEICNAICEIGRDNLKDFSEDFYNKTFNEYIKSIIDKYFYIHNSKAIDILLGVPLKSGLTFTFEPYNIKKQSTLNYECEIKNNLGKIDVNILCPYLDLVKDRNRIFLALSINKFFNEKEIEDSLVKTVFNLTKEKFNIVRSYKK